MYLSKDAKEKTDHILASRFDIIYDEEMQTNRRYAAGWRTRSRLGNHPLPGCRHTAGPALCAPGRPRIIGEPFRAVAPAAGADVVVVTQWGAGCSPAPGLARRHTRWPAHSGRRYRTCRLDMDPHCCNGSARDPGGGIRAMDTR